MLPLTLAILNGISVKVGPEVYILPLIPLHRLFDVAQAVTRPTEGIAVIVQAEGARFALLVDQLVAQHQVVVKNLETNYRKVPGISAATILGDGNVALIVDVAAMQRIQRGAAITAAAGT